MIRYPDDGSIDRLIQGMMQVDDRYWLAGTAAREGRKQEALRLLEEILSDSPSDVRSLTRAGEIYSTDYEALKLDAATSCELAVGYFRRALAERPGDSDTLAGLGLALLTLGRPAEALGVAEQGLAAFDEDDHWQMVLPEVALNVLEAAHDRKIRALLALGDTAGARRAYRTALHQVPGSPYLSRLAPDVGVPAAPGDSDVG